MRTVVFFMVLLILVGGVGLGYQTITSPAATPEPVDRLTVTPRPRATSPFGTATPMATLPPGPGTAAAATPEPGAAASAQPSVTASPGAGQPTGTPAPGQPTGTPTVVTVHLKVGNTGGDGVFLRRSPRMDDKIRPWMDGTAMVVIGPTVTGDGHTWQHVRAPDGSEGYVPSEYLSP